jgi:hypothetical protein
VLLRYILFFLLLVVVWDFVRRLIVALKGVAGVPRPGPGVRRMGAPSRRRDISDADYEILPPPGPDDTPSS